MGLLPATGGKIEIDARLLTVANQRQWQNRIAHVPQTIFLSDTSIEENIAFGVDRRIIDSSRVQLAAKQAQIDTFIESMPKGYQTVVGERGIRLSGGQRQRIGIARALYKQADILILDEATSALDTETEEKVMASIAALNENLTILIVAHRLSTLRDCSQIIELKDGIASKAMSFSDCHPSSNANQV
jgi:ATP-binding cassette subfamily B protein